MRVQIEPRKYMNDSRKPNAVAAAGGVDGSAMHRLWVWICAAEEIGPGLLSIERRQGVILGFGNGGASARGVFQVHVRLRVAVTSVSTANTTNGALVGPTLEIIADPMVGAIEQGHISSKLSHSLASCLLAWKSGIKVFL
jgi:hypothetical protein